MQLFDSCVWFGGLVFVSMLLSVVLDLKAVPMPYLLPILLNFSDIADPVGFSCAVRLSVFCVSLLVCPLGNHWLSMLRLFVDILCVGRLHLSRSRWHGFGGW